MSVPLPVVYREWQAPPPNASENRKLGWLGDACQEGEQWNKSQRGFEDWTKALEIISGTFNDRERLEYRSNLTSNRLKTNVKTVIAGLSSIRPWGGYGATKDFEKKALFMNMVTRALYLQGFWDQSIKATLQWMAVTGSGYIRTVYRRNMAGQGHGNIELDSFGQPSVLPVQMPSNGNYNRAYVTTLMDEKPIWEAHGMFPDYQDKLKPTSSRYWYNAQIRNAAQGNINRRNWNPFTKKVQLTLTDNLIPIRYTRINDLALNTTGHTIPMGEPGTSWAYEVPSFGADMPAGKDRDGNSTFRKATANDARMYPYGRLMISSQDCVMYDGPDFNWDGELNLVQFCLDQWAWEPNGFSMVHDGYTIQKAIQQIDRGVMDKINADMDRPLGYDMNAVGKREANQVDLMQPRQRIAFDGSAVDKPFVQIAPDDVYRVSPETLQMRKELQADLDYILQTRDIVELGKARALGKGMDQLEALIAANGPLVKDMSRSMEKSVCGLANKVKYRVLQYMDTSRVIAYIEESGIREVFDYDPATLIPSHLPGETTEIEGAHVESPTPRIQRARWWAENLTFTLTPHSIHEIHQITYRLMLMQMNQRGYPIAQADIMEANDVAEVRRPTGSTTQERWESEQKEKIEFMAEMQKVVAGSGIDIGQLMGGGAPGKKPEGRKPSGQQAPQMKQKGDGRPVISESG